MEHVRVECGRVCGMNLFHTGVSKHLKLPEFDQSQQQASVQVRGERRGGREEEEGREERRKQEGGERVRGVIG